MKEKIKQILLKSNDRFTLCIELINKFDLSTVAELGVYRGNFAQKILEKSDCIKTYTMIDPWRNLSNWNKPANYNNDTFEAFFQETMQKTNFAKEKRIILRGKTTEVIHKIKDHTYDFVYIDGDHTLKGISIDLINLWPKVKNNGFIVGDDFSSSIWQHSTKFEPTLVFPFAVYFAEAVNAKIYGLPCDQFLIEKKEKSKFEFIDLTNGKYANLELRTQLLISQKLNIKKMVKKTIPFVSKIHSALKK